MAGINVTGYQNWEQVEGPSGGIYYIVPGSDLAYDPITSRSKGRNVFVRDLKGKMEAQKAQQQKQTDALNLQKQQLSPQTQLVPILAGTSATLGGAYLANQLIADPVKDALAQKVLSTIPGNASTVAPQVASPVAQQAGGQVATQVAPQAASSALWSSAPSAVGPMSTMGSVGLGAGVAAGTALSFMDAQNAIKGTKDNSILGIGGRAQNAFLTGGGSEIYRAFFAHKSVKEEQKERWGKLADQGVIGAAEQKQALDSMGDKAGKDLVTGGKWDFNTALARVKGGANDEFRGVYGNYKTFGNDWSTYTPEQQRSIVAGLAGAGLYESKKGDVLVKDESKAREIKDKVLAGTLQPQTSVDPGRVPIVARR